MLQTDKLNKKRTKSKPSIHSDKDGKQGNKERTDRRKYKYLRTRENRQASRREDPDRQAYSRADWELGREESQSGGMIAEREKQ